MVFANVGALFAVSVIVRSAVALPRSVVDPLSRTVSSLSAAPSLIGVNSNVPVPLVSVAAIVKVKLLTAW